MIDPNATPLTNPVLPEVCHRCRKLKARHLGQFHRVPGRFHDRRFVCHACREKQEARPCQRHGSRPMSPGERLALGALISLGRPFHQEYPLGGFRFDFAVPSLRLLIEVDSRTYHSHPSRLKRDRIKTAVANQQGWAVARVIAPDIEFKVRLAVERREVEVLGQSVADEI